jgi:DNA replication and repair protein RecF
MHLARLELEEFRAYRRLDLSLDPAGLRLRGDNASGKSSLLEAIVMLATTRSPRSSVEREVVRWESGADLGVAPYARIRGEIVRRDGVSTVEIALQGDPARPGAARKIVRLNGRPARSSNVVGTLKAVLFSPEDVALVSGSPSGRRRYLDLTVCQTSGVYLRALSRYARILEQRNSLLKSLQRDRVPPDSPQVAGQLAFWDDEISALGATVVAFRMCAVARLSELASGEFIRLTGSGQFRVVYAPSIAAAVHVSVDGGDRAFERIRAAVHTVFREALADRRADEVRRGMSLVGPHRDDFSITVDGVDLAAYGSRGQQRLAVIALKLAETTYMTEVGGEPPILLLDDVLSELDAGHRALLEQAAATVRAQVVVTGAHAEDWTGSGLARLPAAVVVDGVVSLLAPNGSD